jgi:hypothetical protein
MGQKLMHFDVDLPEGWEDQTIYTFRGPEDDTGTPHLLTLVIDRNAGDVELERYAEERVQAVVDSLQGVELLKSEEKVLPSGRPVWEAVIRWIPVDDRVIFRKQVFMLQNGIGHMFSANFSKRTLKTLGVEMDRIIDSYRRGTLATEE